MKQRMKHKGIVVVLLMVCLMVTACDGKTATNTSTPTTEMPTLTSNPVTVTPTESLPGTPTPLPTETPTPTPITASRQISWGIYFYNRPDADAQAEINRLLVEKGYDCTIRFISESVPIDEEIPRWVASNESKYGPLDIYCVGVWNDYTKANQYAKEHFIALNDFLATDTGRPMKLSFSEGAWDSVTSENGYIYTAPRMNVFSRSVDGRLIDSGYNNGIYLSVNAAYAEYFSDFDGTYLSLRKIYDSIGNKDLVIGIEGLDTVMYNALMSYQSYRGYPYDPVKHEFIDLSTSELAKDTAILMWEDLRSNLLNGNGGLSDPSKILAYYHSGIQSDGNGWKQYLIAEDPCILSCAATYGVSVDSEQKELALQILVAVYSDPDLMKLMYPESAFAYNIDERLMLTKNDHAKDFKGFEADFSEERRDDFVYYADFFRHSDIPSESSGLIYLKYNVERFLSKYDSDEYRTILAELNRQMAAHLKKPREETNTDSTDTPASVRNTVEGCSTHKLACCGKYVADLRPDGTVRITEIPEIAGGETLNLEEVAGWKQISSLRSGFEILYGVDGKGHLHASSIHVDYIRSLVENGATSSIVSIAEKIQEWPVLQAFIEEENLADGVLWMTADDSLFLTSKGRLLRFSKNDGGSYGTTEIDRYVVSLTEHYYLREDGSIGTRYDETYNDPEYKRISGWKLYTGLAENAYGFFGLQYDGKITAYPSEYYNSGLPMWENITKLAAEGFVVVALHEDGTVSVALGAGKTDKALDEVANWSSVIDIATDGKIIAAKKADGTIVYAVLGNS